MGKVRILIAFFLLLPAYGLCAWETDYDRMRGEMDDCSLPLVNLCVDMANVCREEYTPAEVEIADRQKRTDNKEVARFRCKVRFRGATALRYEKKSFALKLIDSDGEDLDANIMGIREENSWILDAMAIDRTRMRNRVCFDIWNEISRTPYTTKYGNRNATLGTFVEVFVNGGYHGLYCLSDKIDRKLLGLKKSQKDANADVTVRGLLYKGKRWGGASGLLSYDSSEPMDSDYWNAWELQYPDDCPSEKTWRPLADLVDFCSAPEGVEYFGRHYTEHFYPSNLIDYITFVNALYIMDTGYKNTFLSMPDITSAYRRFLITPWDLDSSLGGLYNGEYWDYVVDKYWLAHIGPFNNIFTYNIDGFIDGVRERWQQLNTTVLSVAEVSRRLDAYAEMFVASGAWERERSRWDNNPVELKEDINEELDYVKDWYSRNFISFCNQLDEASGVGNTNGATSSTPRHIHTLGGARLQPPYVVVP